MPSEQAVIPPAHVVPQAPASQLGVPRLHPVPPSKGMPASGLWLPASSPPASTAAQAFGHWPQCFVSLCRSEHTKPPSESEHFVSGVSHWFLHVPAEQTW